MSDMLERLPHMNTARFFAFALVAVSTTTGLAASQPLFTFGTAFDAKRVQTNDATCELSGTALKVRTGHTKPWPGITLSAPGKWDLTPFGHVEAEVKNTGRSAVSVSCRVDNPNATGTEHCVTAAVKLEPGERQILRVALTRASSSRMDGKLFGMRGYPVAPGGRGTLDAANVTQILFFVANPKQEHEFQIADVRAAGTYTAPTASVTDADPFFPFIDTFGQYKHKDWPGKLHSEAEFAQRRDAEAKELTAKNGPADWNEYGGWTGGPQLRATGFFRTEKHNGKWWLVDPKGRLFFSSGVDCVAARHFTPIDERAEWFEKFPGDQPAFKPYLSSGFALKGHYAGKRPKTFSFNSANLQRKYGPDWKEANGATIHQRLRSWGLNTIANWSDDQVRMMRRTPYTDTIGSRGGRMIEGSEGYWSKFPDTFDPAFAEGVRKQMQAKRGRTAGDPLCIGYFSDNEMSWGDELSLAAAVLKSPPSQPAKGVFVQDLKAKYATIEKLNSAWGTDHASWDTLLASTNAPDRKKAEQDLGAFYTRIAEQYFRVMRDGIKEVAPQQLYFGCRFAWVNDRAAAAAGKFCDVVSYNLYKRSVADFKYNGGVDVPLIIGEFHFGALDRGMLHTGLVPVATQEARAQAYRDYVEGALRHPQFVGCHWFEYQDEPLTGRVYDEENYQIGLVDVTDTPYPETIATLREIGAKLYQTRAGR
jgi:hypothetical protein